MLSSAPEKKLSYIKTHTHYNSEILKLINDRVKIIFTFRDLRDVMISRYYHILQDKVVYKDLGADHLENLNKDKQIKHHIKRLRELGMDENILQNLQTLQRQNKKKAA